MAIKLAHNCINCEQLQEGSFCKKHLVQVGEQYTCDSFMMKASIFDDHNCLTCSRYENATSCANPEKAAPQMLCSSWAPPAQA